MCEITFKNIFNMYFNNVENDIMLKVIAFRAVEEAINSNLIEDLVSLFECEIFSEKFRNYLIKGFAFNVSLDETICINLISKKNVDFESLSLDELNMISNKFSNFKLKFNSDVFKNIDYSLKDYILNKSLKNKDYGHIINFIKNNENYCYLRSKYLMKIENNISTNEYKNLRYLIDEDLFCEIKNVPKRIIEKRNKGALKHLI